jgi:hypothetical protein
LTADPTPYDGRSWVGLRVTVAVTVVVVWAGFMLALVTLGSCDAFAGRCDGTRPPILEDDVSGGAFIGTAVAAWLLWWLSHPSKRRATSGVPIALGAAVVAVIVARQLAHA